jgi:hypothetical protein
VWLLLLKPLATRRLVQGLANEETMLKETVCRLTYTMHYSSIVAQLINEFPASEGSSTSSQNPDIIPYPEPFQILF